MSETAELGEAEPGLRTMRAGHTRPRRPPAPNCIRAGDEFRASSALK